MLLRKKSLQGWLGKGRCVPFGLGHPHGNYGLTDLPGSRHLVAVHRAEAGPVKIGISLGFLVLDNAPVTLRYLSFLIGFRSVP